jgi:hypothetical protein
MITEFETDDGRQVKLHNSFLSPKGQGLKNVWVLRAASGRYIDHAATLGALLLANNIDRNNLLEVEE